MRSTHCFYSPMWIDFWISQALKFNYIFFLQILCFRFCITDFVRSTIWLHSPAWIDFWLFIGVEVQSMLFIKRFLFFPPEASALFSIGRLSYGGYSIYAGETALPSPLQPPTYLMCSSIGSQGVLYDGLCAFNNLASFTNVGWLLIAYGVEVQSMLFVKRFLFFPPEAFSIV